MFVLGNVIKPQGLEPLQFPTKFRAPSVLSHSTIAPAVVDPVMIEQLTEILLSKSPIHLKRLSSHPEGKALVPLIGLETGSVRMAKQVMPSKGVPFKIEDWQSVVINGLEVLNRNNLVSDAHLDGG